MLDNFFILYPPFLHPYRQNNDRAMDQRKTKKIIGRTDCTLDTISTWLRQQVSSNYAILFKVFELFSIIMIMKWKHIQKSLQWRHNGRDSVSNHQPRDSLLSRFIRRRSKKTSKLRVISLCVGNSPETGEFPAQRTSNAEKFSIWWRHHMRIRPWDIHRHNIFYFIFTVVLCSIVLGNFRNFGMTVYHNQGAHRSFQMCPSDAEKAPNPPLKAIGSTCGDLCKVE